MNSQRPSQAPEAERPAPETAPARGGEPGTAVLLKVAFAIGALALVWLLLRAGGSATPEWDPLGAAGPADFAPWTPAP